MNPVERLEHALRHPKSKTALVAYLTGGWPDRNQFCDLLRSVASVADAVEIGVPFSDPMADGPTIQKTSQEALKQGVTLAWILETLTTMEPKPEAPILLMGYLNPFLAFELPRLAEAAEAAGVSGFIVPDLPFEEAETFRSLMAQRGMGLVQLVTPVTPPDRRRRLTEASRGFVYAVTVTGITGGDVAAGEQVADTLMDLRDSSTVPVMAGFGIRRPDQVSVLAPIVDGVIVGSALLDCIREGRDPVPFLSTLSSAGEEVSS